MRRVARHQRARVAAPRPAGGGPAAGRGAALSPSRRPPRPLAPERAWSYALWLLGRQAYTASELGDRLARRGLDPALCVETVARLQELQLLDDRAFAASFVRRRRDERGRLALRADLRRKGIDEALIERVLAGDDDDPGLSDEQQLTAATALLAKHAWRFAGRPAPAEPRGDAEDGAAGDGGRDPRLDRQRSRARAAAFLARRGFTPGVVSEALALAFRDPDDD
ncbi:MAG: recombination regulator RecX [Trueperaceae bacterium]|nr:recombination regulator RecX [Trueperaceae bacterium]